MGRDEGDDCLPVRSRLTAFVDANVVLYATGTVPAFREPCISILETSARAEAKLLTSAEVLQEVLYVRQRTLGREIARNAVQLATTSLLVFPLLPEDVVAASLLDAPSNLQTRDLLHLATMARLGLTQIVSSDRAFERVAGIERLDPMEFEGWRERVFAAE